MRVFCLLLLLAGCASEQPLFTRADSVFVAAGLPVPRKIKAGTVILQAGPNASATVANNQKAGQRGGAAATAPNATATATTKKAGVPWWVFLLVAGVGAGVWEYVSHQGLLAWLPWRARPG